MKRYVIKVGARFWVSGKRFSEEYPDAYLFTTEKMARRMATKISPEAVVEEIEIEGAA